MSDRKITIPEFEEWIERNGVNFRPWTPDEEDILQTYYGRIPTPMLAKKLQRTIKAVNEKARRMGIRADHDY